MKILTTVKKVVDVVLNMHVKDGAIIENGSHAELLAQHGHYYRLYTSQFRSEMEREYVPGDLAAVVAD